MTRSRFMSSGEGPTFRRSTTSCLKTTPSPPPRIFSYITWLHLTSTLLSQSSVTEKKLLGVSDPKIRLQMNVCVVFWMSKSGAPAKKALNTYFHCLQESTETNCHQIQAPNFLLVKLVSVFVGFKKKPPGFIPRTLGTIGMSRPLKLSYIWLRFHKTLTP